MLPAAFFERSLRTVAKDLRVLNVRQVKRGPHLGQLVNYTYSYFSPSLKLPVHMRAELFGHSRPGKVFSITCNTGALSPVDAERAFGRELKSFERLSASLRING